MWLPSSRGGHIRQCASQVIVGQYSHKTAFGSEKGCQISGLLLACWEISDLPIPPPDGFQVGSLRWRRLWSVMLLFQLLCKLCSFFYVSWWTYFDPLLFFWLTYPGGMYAFLQLYKSRKAMQWERQRKSWKKRKAGGWFSCHYFRGGIEEPKSPKCQAVWPVSNTTHKTLRF